MNSGNGLAECGSFVEVNLVSEREPVRRFFAVGMAGMEEAGEAILRFPGVFRED